MAISIPYFRAWLMTSCFITVIQAISLFIFSIDILIQTRFLYDFSTQTLLTLWLISVTIHALIVVGTTICGTLAITSKKRVESNICYFTYNSIWLFISYLVQGIVILVIAPDWEIYAKFYLRHLGRACIIESIFFLHNLVVAVCFCSRSDKKEFSDYKPVESNPRDNEAISNKNPQMFDQPQSSKRRNEEISRQNPYPDQVHLQQIQLNQSTIPYQYPFNQHYTSNFVAMTSNADKSTQTD